MDIGILILRVVVGLTMAAHGGQKLFGWFKGPGLAGTAGWLGSMGFRPAKAYAGISGASEFAGGILLAVGLLTPLGAAAVVGSMIAAISLVHRANGFFSTEGGYEFNAALIAAAVAVAFAGPGAYSVDAVFGWELAGTMWGIAAVVLGAAAAISVVGSRRKPEAIHEAVPEEREPARAA